MSVLVQAADLTRARDLLTLYKKKDAFNFEELSDVSDVYKHIATALEEAGDKPEASVSKKDVAYLLSAMNVCSQRAPMELQNYKPIASLFETFSEALKAADSEEETKEA
jgi:flagellar basal body-associated protein FliL